ncbi:MAG TPA: PEP-CTERM sorting domain-containing protein [Rhodanobacteraceae bacterium]|jgi:hypothetical protein|nr:PEP-CTERM sorting domain-containing protein [Rhodanobacteraceae bacterium]
MSKLSKRLGIAAVWVVGMLFASIAGATAITMDFDGLAPLSSVDHHYDGGCAKFGGALNVDCGGPDYGVVWKGAWTGLPESPGFMTPFLGPATMNVAAGFDTSVSFHFYSIAIIPMSVSVYSGLDGSGTKLADVSLPWAIGHWDFLDLSFSGIAKSVIFSASYLLGGFDDVTIGTSLSATPVPEPAVLGMFGFGVLLIGVAAGMRRRACNA